MANKRGRPAGYIMSKESKQKTSDNMIGRQLSKKHRKNISKSMLNNNNAYIHGFSNKHEYLTFRNMLDRCYNTDNKQYKDYGGRGIIVEDSWKNNFLTFCSDILNTIGPKPCKESTLDRIDNDKGYSIDNMRWADRTVQELNRRVSGREPFTEGIFSIEKGYTWLVVITKDHYCRCVARVKTEAEAKEILKGDRK